MTGAPSPSGAAVPDVRGKKSGPGAVWRGVAHWLGSLQVAVAGLALFGAALAVGTVVESWYSGKLAQELVYRAWWFSLLIGLLGGNIFFAAAKKWPWKKHQTGFVITHLGLLMLVAGGILNALGGTDALMVLVDTRDADLQREHGATQETARTIERDRAAIAVQLPPKGREKGEAVSYAFEPGSLPWRADPSTQTRVGPLLAGLSWLAHPLPRAWEADLPDGARLEVLDFYPAVRPGRFKAAEPGAAKTFPALRFQLASPMAGTLPEDWVALRPGEQTSERGAGLVEFLGTCPAPVLDEFCAPPPKEPGAKGQLVLWLGGGRHRIPVDAALDRALPVGETGWRMKVVRYVPDLVHAQDPDADPADPAVEFDLLSPDGRTTPCAALARFSRGTLFKAEAAEALTDLRVWYHPPDYQYGKKPHPGRRDGLRALLQLVKGDGGRLYYRSFHTDRRGDFTFEKAGAVGEGRVTLDIWPGMDWKFHVLQWLPEAVPEPEYVPVDLRPGGERPGNPPAVRCRLTKGSQTSEEFWVTQTDGGRVRVPLGDEEYRVGYHVKAEPLPFSLRLLRAEQTNDGSSAQAATYASYVQLTDPEEKVKDEDHVISMNAPLYHRGYKFYQSGYELVDLDRATDKPVSRSVFTVGYDPGIYLKYLGQIMLGAGIFTMFYMRAYFFKPRGKKAPAGADGPPAAAAQEG
jgi:hypothetical protein